MKARLNIEDYAKRVCIERCKFYEEMQKILIVNGDPNQKWSWLFHAKCSKDCPLEAMIQSLREERDQMMEVELEFV